MRLSEAISGYLRQKRSLGFGYKTHEFEFLAFQQFATDLPIQEVTSEIILNFLNSRRTTPNTWMNTQVRLRQLFEFWTDRGYMAQLEMPQRQRVRTPPPIPFVYTKRQISQLIQAGQKQWPNHIRAVTGGTFRTVVLTIYGTGALPMEILLLRRSDLDLKRDLIFLRGNALIRPRSVPIGRDLHVLLSAYLNSRERKRVHTNSVFISSLGKSLSPRTFTKAFARLRIYAGLIREDGGRNKPRIYDLRQTFAVHRIASWIEEGADLNRMLPALSAYLGLSGFAAAQRFVLMTPDRFKSALDKLSPRKATRRWHDDPKLMEFLTGL